MNTSFFNQKENTWQIVGPGISRQILGYDDHLMLVKVKFELNAVGILHQHIHSQTTYIESGVFEFTIGTEKSKLAAGDSCFMLSNIPHGCICIEPGILVDIFSPVRADFLQS